MDKYVSPAFLDQLKYKYTDGKLYMSVVIDVIDVKSKPKPFVFQTVKRIIVKQES
jgi:hypothetical protein